MVHCGVSGKFIMLMLGQPDILDMLLGNKAGDVLTPDGEINFFIPQVARDQQLEPDLLDSIDTNDETTLLTYMDEFVDDECSVVEVIAETIELPQETPSTSSTTISTSEVSEAENQYFFQFPDPSTDQFSTIDLGFLTEVSDINDIAFTDNVTAEISDVNDMTFTDDVTDSESTYSTAQMPPTPFSPTSPSYSLLPPTPDTASSLDSTTSNMPSFIKEELNLAIRNKRHREGKTDLKVEFIAPLPEQLTEEEVGRRVDKREKNKLAAQKCREKKRVLGDRLEAETKKLQKKKTTHKLEIQKLLDEREHLMEIINIHRAVCPKFRARSSNF